MSLTLETAFMIFEGAALIALLAIGAWLLRAEQKRRREAARHTDAEKQVAERGEQERPPAGAEAEDALAARLANQVETALAEHKAEFELWARGAVKTIDQRLAAHLTSLEQKLEAAQRPTPVEPVRSSISMQRPSPAAAPAAAPTASSASAHVPQPAAAAPSPRPAPAPATGQPSFGVQLSRPAAADVFRDASAWLSALGLDESEKEQLRATCSAPEPAEAVRKLFAALHKIASERRLSDERPKLSWARVGSQPLRDFIGRFCGQETTLIWPRIGDSFEPRTMHAVFKEESGAGTVTEFVAPGYGAGADVVKALVVY